MTENKRFILEKESNILLNKGKRWAYWNVEQEKIIEKLNQLNDENKRLKSEIEKLKHKNNNELLNNLRIELTSRMNDCFEEFKI